MKELSVEAKAYDGNYKAYIELINRLEDVKEAIKKQNYGVAMDILFKPYPQFQVITHSALRESGDERVLKIIKETLKSYNRGIISGSLNAIDYADCLAWLEKRDNNMGISEATKKKLENNLNKALEKETPESCNEFLEKQGEQKPAEEYNITGIGSKNAQGKLGEMIKNLKPVNEILEQKPWSEEDEKILNLIIARLHSHPSVEAEEYGKDYHWLKSLKDRYTWKPSDEQMEALLYEVNAWDEDSINGRDLKSLYQDLKNLSGE